MITKVKLDIGQESKFHRSLPAADGLRFSCAGEGCMASEKCARWNRMYKEKCSKN